MDELYAGLLNDLTLYIHNEDTLSNIERAFEFAKKAHEGQKRASGKNYIFCKSI